MQTANVMVALSGDQNNTVPKYNVTPGEIALLEAIHGRGAVSDIQPSEPVATTNRAERERLRLVYGQARDNNGGYIFEILFPGVAARVHERFDELDLEPGQFAAINRYTAPEEDVSAQEDEVEEVVAEEAPAKKTKEKKAPTKKQKAPEPVEDSLDELPADDVDGVLD